MVDSHYSLNLKPWSARTLYVYAHADLTQKYSIGLQEIFVSMQFVLPGRKYFSCPACPCPRQKSICLKIMDISQTVIGFIFATTKRFWSTILLFNNTTILVDNTITNKYVLYIRDCSEAHP
jgi:hypothetical protein